MAAWASPSPVVTNADGLRANGAAGVVITLVSAGLFALHRRQEGDVAEEYAEMKEGSSS